MTTPLRCPKCNSSLAVRVETRRIISFTDEYGYNALLANTSTAEWGSPEDEDTEECIDVNCGDDTCSANHEYDKQRNAELINSDITMSAQLTWDYEVDELSEDVVRIESVACTNYRCDYKKTFSKTVEMEISFL